MYLQAGPIEEISFAKNGKACFIVYEHPDAVVTAKDIFRDVKLNGRPLRMFDQDEIAKVHSLQEEQIEQNRNYKYENDPSQNYQRKSYEGSYYPQDSQSYSSYNRNVPDYRRSERYSDLNRHNPAYNNATPSYQPRMENDQSRDWRANSVHNPSMTYYSHNNSTQSRPDLLPSTSSQSSKKLRFDNDSTIHDLMNCSHSLIDNLMNPYDMPVSRSSHDEQNRSSNRSYQQNRHEYDDNFSENFIQNQWTSDYHPYSHNFRSENDHRAMRSTPEQFNPVEAFSDSVYQGDTRQNQQNKYRNDHSGHYRDQPYRKHKSDHKARNQPYPVERDRRHREQPKYRSRRY